MGAPEGGRTLLQAIEVRAGSVALDEAALGRALRAADATPPVEMHHQADVIPVGSGHGPLQCGHSRLGAEEHQVARLGYGWQHAHVHRRARRTRQRRREAHKLEHQHLGHRALRLEHGAKPCRQCRRALLEVLGLGGVPF